MRARRVLAAFVVIGAAVTVGAAVAVAAPVAAARHSALPSPDPLLHELFAFKVRYRDLLGEQPHLVRRLRVPYRAWDGTVQSALLVVPRWYGPRVHPPIPLVISPHGRGITARANARFWGSTPAFGPFAVVCPEGRGRRLTLYSWGWRGQIDDLARMPRVLRSALPWLRIDRRRIYAVGSSMGGQETLLLVALHPRMLAGAAALDSATDMAARYRAFPQLVGGHRLQALARIEIGGTPRSDPRAYVRRSPIAYARRIAESGVPLHLWWSTRDRIVVDQNRESGLLYRMIRRDDPRAPVSRYVGTWRHSHEMHPLAQMPRVLLELKLLTLDAPLPTSIRP